MRSITIIILLSVCFLGNLSCQKQVSNSNLESQQDSTTSKKVVAWLDLQKDNIRDSAGKTTVSNLKSNLVFSSLAIEQLNNEERLIIIALKPDFKTLNITSQKTLKSLVVIENLKGEFRLGNIIEVIPQKQILEKLPQNLISKVYNNKRNELNGIVSIMTLTNHFIYELEYKEGKLSATKYMASKKDKDPDENTTGKINSCIAWYLVVTTYYSDGTRSESWTYLYTSCSDDCQTTRTIESSSPFKLKCGGGNGGGDGDNSVELVTTDTIIKLLQNPCFVSVVNGISSAKFKNQIVQLFNETYVGNGHVANLKFIENTNLLNADGSPRAAKSSIEPYTWVIQMNPNYGNAVSTEFWGSVVIHELVHSFITIYRSQNPPLNQFEQHEQIFQKWINQMTNFLYQCYNISTTDATALALGGLDEVLKEYVGNDPVFKQKYENMALQKYNISLITAENIRNDYKAGTKGSTCQ